MIACISEFHPVRKEIEKLGVVKIGMKIATHLSANIGTYAPCARFIFLNGKNMAALSKFILQMVTYFPTSSHVKPWRVKMRMQAGRKEHKNNKRGHLVSFTFALDTN